MPSRSLYFMSRQPPPLPTCLPLVLPPLPSTLVSRVGPFCVFSSFFFIGSRVLPNLPTLFMCTRHGPALYIIGAAAFAPHARLSSGSFYDFSFFFLGSRDRTNIQILSLVGRIPVRGEADLERGQAGDGGAHEGDAHQLGGYYRMASPGTAGDVSDSD